MSWTLFWDMHSGGGTKQPPYEKVYIEAPEAEARVIFYNRFGHSADRVSCTCCGEDYSVSEEPTFEEASAFHRNLPWVHPAGDGGVETRNLGRYLDVDEEMPKGWVRSRLSSYRTPMLTVDEYVKQDDVLVIRADEIQPSERRGEVPEQGYVWR